MDEGLRNHYQRLWNAHADSPKAVQWTDESTQRRRFEILVEGLPDGPCSILDIGCGTGHLWDFIKNRRDDVTYHGVDFVPEFIHHANDHRSGPRSTFDLLDIIDEELPDQQDFAIISGIFNNRMDDNQAFMETVLTKASRACEKGVLFNALSTYVDYEDDHLHYTDPREAIDFCKNNVAPFVTLRHDYLVKPNSIPFEFSIYCYHAP